MSRPAKTERTGSPINRWEFQDKGYVCRICQASLPDEESLLAVGTWYRLNLRSIAPLDNTDATCGFFCSLDCLLVGVMRPYGMREGQVRQWIKEL